MLLTECLLAYIRVGVLLKLWSHDEMTMSLVSQELRRRGVQTVDFALIDHLKTLYLQDLLVMQQHGLFRQGSVVVGDNVLIPGSPDFRRHMATSPDFCSKEHITNMEYSHFIPDLVTVSEFRGQ